MAPRGGTAPLTQKHPILGIPLAICLHASVGPTSCPSICIPTEAPTQEPVQRRVNLGQDEADTQISQ